MFAGDSRPCSRRTPRGYRCNSDVVGLTPIYAPLPAEGRRAIYEPQRQPQPHGESSCVRLFSHDASGGGHFVWGGGCAADHHGRCIHRHGHRFALRGEDVGVSKRQKKRYARDRERERAVTLAQEFLRAAQASRMRQIRMNMYLGCDIIDQMREGAV